MALVATVFETTESLEEAAAVEWLGTLSPPDVVAPTSSARTSVEFYVPVNDRSGDGLGALQGLANVTRSKQARFYPTQIPQDQFIDFEYRSTRAEFAIHRSSLESVASAVVRLGHSSSLVAVSLLADEVPVGERIRWVADGAGAVQSAQRLRVAGDGSFARLEASFGRERRRAFHRAKDDVDTAKGKARKDAAARFEEITGLAYKSSLKAAPPAPARISRLVEYRQVQARSDLGTYKTTPLDDQFFILSKADGPALDLLATLKLTHALRGLVLSHAGKDAPGWVTGHATDGSPSRDLHLTYLPLPYVGNQYSDGHVMGLAICLPRKVDVSEAARYLGPVIADQSTGTPRRLELRLGRLGTWKLELETRPEPPATLTASTWVGRPASHEWASVTPVVLERFPKTNRNKDHRGWMEEVEGLVRQSCVHAGLPEPLVVETGRNAWCQGVPRAVTRPSAKGGRDGHATDKSQGLLGSGYPLFSDKVQVHVNLLFDRPVRGPVVLGGGRFRGYGMCRPRYMRGGIREMKETASHETN